MTDNNEIEQQEETLDAEELALELARQRAEQERAARKARQSETLEEFAEIIMNTKLCELQHYGVIREVVVNDDSIIVIGTGENVIIFTPYERPMYTDELQRVGAKQAKRNGHDLSDWTYSYGSELNIAVCKNCGEPVVQSNRDMPKGASVLNERCKRAVTSEAK
jgi:hypothetical protein